MRRSLAKFSESEASNHTPPLADFTTTTPELKFSVHTGITGIVALYAMWLAHLLLFRGDGLSNWIGLLVVQPSLIRLDQSVSWSAARD
jgi:hypothetical protein